MIKINLMRLFSMVVAVLFVVGTTDAQTKLWGVGAAVGASDADFSAPFVNATSFTAGTNPTSWTALTISNTDGAPTPSTLTPGAAYWTRSMTGRSQGAYATNMTAIASPSQANGTALFDSDFMDNGGTPGAFGSGTAPSVQVGDLISPRIDLTGNTNVPLSVRFFCKWRNFQVNNLLVSLSTDDGLSWTDVSIPNLLPADVNSTAEGELLASFFNATAGVANLTQCRLRFRFDGDYYYCLVDDITIETAPKYDIAISLPVPGGTTLADAFTNVRVGNNRYIADGNIDAADLKEWFWGMKVVNKGYADLLSAAMPRAKMSIDYTDPITGLTTTAVYLDTMDIADTLLLDGGNDVVPVENLRDIAFVATNGVGDYDVKYWVEHDSMDGNASNDTTFHRFSVTGAGATATHYLSKARLSQDGKVFASRPIFPGGGPEFSEFEYGSMYYFPKGATDAVRIDSVDYRYYVPNAYSGTAAQTIAVNVYQFVDGSNGGTADGTLDDSGSELAYIGIGLSNIPAVAANGSYAPMTVSSFIDPGTGLAMPAFTDNGFYVVSLYENPSTLIPGGAATFNSNSGIWFGADELNYAINAAMTSTADLIPHPSPVKVIESTGAGDWNWVGFGADMVPSIGLHLSGTFTIGVDQVVWEDAGVGLELYPNPATDLLNVEVLFDEPTDVTYVLTDVTGRVIKMQLNKNVTNEVESVDVSKLPAGVYLVTAKTEKGATTKRFVKK